MRRGFGSRLKNDGGKIWVAANEQWRLSACLESPVTSQERVMLSATEE
jgi:hypothetical protein